MLTTSNSLRTLDHWCKTNLMYLLKKKKITEGTLLFE